jgi:hypothetical protein
LGQPGKPIIKICHFLSFIEPHPFDETDSDHSNPFAHEILNTGIGLHNFHKKAIEIYRLFWYYSPGSVNVMPKIGSFVYRRFIKEG